MYSFSKLFCGFILLYNHVSAFLPIAACKKSLISHISIILRHANGSSPTRATGFGGESNPTTAKRIKKQPKRGSQKQAETTSNSFQEAALRDPAEAKRILGLYGGDIQQGTIRRISAARLALQDTNPRLGEAMQLKEDQLQWERSIKGLSLLQQSEIPALKWEQEIRRKYRLEESDRVSSVWPTYLLHPDHFFEPILVWTYFLQEHGISAIDIHNAFQRITWDASADARAFRGNADVSTDMQARIGEALKYAVEVVLKAGVDGRMLDVGCGTGVLVKALQKQGLQPDKIVGLDISPEMTRVASKAHPGVSFVTGDFLKYNARFDCVLFCMSLHDLPVPTNALKHAVTLLRPGGRIVISHPRGADHVVMQNRKNPLMVPNTLPTREDLTKLCIECGLNLKLDPSNPGDSRDKAEGYLYILEKELGQ